MKTFIAIAIAAALSLTGIAADARSMGQGYDILQTELTNDFAQLDIPMESSRT